MINKGIAVKELEGEVLGVLPPGSYFAATCLLGTTQMPPCTMRTQSMCHILILSRSDFYNCYDQYRDAKKTAWLRAAKEAETAVYEKAVEWMRKRARQRK